MGFKLSNNSLVQYETLDENLRIIIDEALKISNVDFGISQGHRSPELQMRYFKKGRQLVNGKWEIVDKSKVVTYLDGYEKKSKHNYFPSKAFDFFVWVPGKKGLMYDSEHLAYLAGLFWAISEQLYTEGKINKKIRWGGNWDSDGEIVTDQSFDDLPHVELI